MSLISYYHILAINKCLKIGPSRKIGLPETLKWLEYFVCELVTNNCHFSKGADVEKIFVLSRNTLNCGSPFSGQEYTPLGDGFAPTMVRCCSELVGMSWGKVAVGMKIMSFQT